MCYTDCGKENPQMRHVQTKVPNVLLRLPTSIKTMREFFNGILGYVRCRGPWMIQVVEGRPGEMPEMPPENYDGIITTLGPEKSETELFLKIKRPVIGVDVSERARGNRGFPGNRIRVEPENEPIGTAAAEFLLARQIRNFAFVGEVRGVFWSEQRQKTFCGRIRTAGFDCSVFPGGMESAGENFERGQQRLAIWLNNLPKPVGVFAANDIRARQVLDACLRAEISVPREVAVLGVDNDESLCETAHPQLSSIQMSCAAAGFKAAEVLDCLMRGKKAETRVIRYGFESVVPRASTAIRGTNDFLVVKALEILELNSTEGISVDALAKQLRVSRRYLEIRFKTETGRSVHEELIQMRLERAAGLLRTDEHLSVEETAAICGFSDASHLNRFFVRKFGVPPSIYRRG